VEPLDRLKILSSQMDFEPAEDYRCPQIDARREYSGFVHNAVMPNGKTIPLLKTLLSSACERDCHYCPFRAGRNFRRATLKPEEMAHVFMAFHRAGIVEGLFLSSGLIGGGTRTQDRLLDTAQILREKLGFRGYLHLKIMPGAEFDQVAQAMQLADRVSINLEAPNPDRLQILAPHKKFADELLRPLKIVNDIKHGRFNSKPWRKNWPSVATQFVVGGAGESDLELLSTTEYLYNKLRLKRAYFSPFKPVDDTPLADCTPTPLQRENRLYQASFLIRDYGFELEEMPFDPLGNLPEEIDPKLGWAKAHLGEKPLEINTATRQELLHVPGIGPKSARSLISARRKSVLKNIEDLRRIGINPSRAAPFILINGRKPSVQLALI
jgi:predicted DNA-binding helix-hairpin-helix protein